MQIHQQPFLKRRLFKRRLLSLIAAVFLLLASFPASLQDENSSVPNVVGMNIPQATAELNRVGLGLGSQISEAWTESSGLPQNTISSQSIAAGQALSPGMLVDVVVLRAPNTILSYDDNDLTLINTTGADLNLNGLIFGVAEGTVPAAFAATRWAGALSAGGCGQVWSVLRSVPKDVEGCGRINAWLTTNNAAEHFWTVLNGVSRFKIVQNGVERGSCPAAPAGTQPLRCELYLPANASEGITPYIYFAYTPERFIIHNRSQDQFMPLAGTPLYSTNPNLSSPGQSLNPGDPGLYRLLNPVATVTQLAPNQCVLFTNSSNPESLETPEPCEVIARLDIDPNLTFWAVNFEFDSATDGRRRTCAGATAGRLTICVMPR